MSIKIFTTEDFKVSLWSGGKTTQYWISPGTSTLEDRNFDFRISSAVVEVPESEFSSFDGYTRILMVLDGELQLDHREHHSIALKPFDQDLFQGSWQTHSIGQAQDFNVIYRGNVHVDLDHRNVNAGGYLTLCDCEETFVLVYRGEGTVKGIAFKEGDLIHIEQEQLASIHGDQDLKLIVVWLKNVDN